MNRIDTRFALLKQQKRAALVPFIMAGDPGYDMSLSILKSLPGAGADIIELGMAFSDPMADGPVIQAAGKRALDGGITTSKILSMVKEFRALDADTPVILMGYYNPIYHYGVEQFCKDAVAAGVDGMIIVDLPPEEEAEFVPSANKVGLILVRLVAPTTHDARLPFLLKSAKGYLYYIAVKGITGAQAASENELKQAVARLRKHTSLPVAVGFGIKSKQQVTEASNIADAVVVGSALVSVIAEHASAGTSVEKAVEFLKSLQ